MIRSIVFFLAALMGLTACSPWRDTYTLSPAVKESARRYSDVMDDFADQALLANVLRAKDYAPMNFNDLSSITGSLSLSGTLGLTFPFGPYNGDPGAATLGARKNTATPSITTTTSPVISIGTLNTQGFMMTMIQPISTTYVLSKWDSYPHELLLYLFVKSIRFPDESDSAPGCMPIDAPQCSKRVTHRNNPDIDTDFRDFKQLLEQMTSKSDSGGNVDMRSLTLLDPLGVPIPIGRQFTSTVPVPSANPTTSIPPPGHPSLHAIALPGAPAATYFVRLTFVTNAGESAVSDESQVPVDPGQGLEIDAPTAPPGVSPAPTLYNVYVSTVPGTETRQNPRPMATHWTMTDPTLLVGASPPATSGTQYQVNSDYNIFQVINGLSDGQLHVGNKHCPKEIKNGVHTDDLCPPGNRTPFAQFYKEYAGQVVLCVNTDQDGLLAGHEIAPMTELEKSARLAQLDAQQKLESANKSLTTVQGQRANQISVTAAGELPDTAAFDAQIQDLRQKISDLTDRVTTAGEAASGGDQVAVYLAASMKPPPSSTGTSSGTTPPPSGGAAAPTGGGASGGTAGGTGAMPQVTLALQPSRISAMIHSEGCKSDQIVFDPQTERQFERENSKFTHIEWRSIAEVIQYLGAVARYQDGHDTDQAIGWSEGEKTHRLFTYAKGTDGRITVDTREGPYTVPKDYPHPKTGLMDHSLQTLALLNELIAIAKVSGSLSVPQPVQVLP